MNAKLNVYSFVAVLTGFRMKEFTEVKITSFANKNEYSIMLSRRKT